MHIIEKPRGILFERASYIPTASPDIIIKVENICDTCSETDPEICERCPKDPKFRIETDPCDERDCDNSGCSDCDECPGKCHG